MIGRKEPDGCGRYSRKPRTATPHRVPEAKLRPGRDRRIRPRTPHSKPAEIPTGGSTARIPNQKTDRHTFHAGPCADDNYSSIWGSFVEKQNEENTSRYENQRNVPTSQARIGEDIVGQSLQLPGRFPPVQDRDRMAITAQKSFDPGIQAAKIPVGIIAAGGDHGIERCGPVIHCHRDIRLNLFQLVDDETHQHRIFARHFHQAAMSGRNDTQQIEKADQRNIAGHDDQNGAGRQGAGRS